MSSPRRHDLDWLRVIAILLLVLFHVGMVFVPWEFHIKNDVTSDWLLMPMYFLSTWRMSLLFFISGIGTMFAFKRRNADQYTGERIRRLLIPVLIGFFFIIPPQIWAERVFQGVVYDSYFHFWIGDFKMEAYPHGSISWHHLWFVMYLFCYSILAMPFFLWLRRSAGKRWLEKVDHFFARPGAIYLLAIAPAIAQATLRPIFPTTHDLFFDWATHGYYGSMFVLGYFVANLKQAWAAIPKHRLLHLSLALLSMAYLQVELFVLDERLLPAFPYWVLKSFCAWFFILGLSGYAARYLNFDNRFIRYANEGIYPFYILHQSVELPFALYVVKWEMAWELKFTILTALTFFVSLLIYELGIRRFNIMRILFGMKPKTSVTARGVNAASLQPVGEPG